MKISKDNFFVSIVGKELEGHVFSGGYEYNTEIAFFALKDVVAGEYNYAFEKVKKAVLSSDVKLTLHGPFMELMFDSRDSEVRCLARQKILKGIETASKLGASHIVCHSTYNPLSRTANHKYDDLWHSQSTAFWREIVPVAESFGCVIALENIFDDSPVPIKRLADELASDFFKICLDTGHANIFSDLRISDWVNVFGEELVHIHAHDNLGEEDLHLGLGKGCVDFLELFNAIETAGISPNFVLEVRGAGALADSFNFLRRNSIIDF